MAFPSLKKFETEVVSMAADLFHGGPEASGNMTSGGTESILLAVKTAKDRAVSEGKTNRAWRCSCPERASGVHESGALLRPQAGARSAARRF